MQFGVQIHVTHCHYHEFLVTCHNNIGGNIPNKSFMLPGVHSLLPGCMAWSHDWLVTEKQYSIENFPFSNSWMQSIVQCNLLHILSQYFNTVFNWQPIDTVEPFLKDHPHWPQQIQQCGLSRQVVSGDRFSYTEMQVFLPQMCGLSRQVVSHGSGLSQVSL